MYFFNNLMDSKSLQKFLSNQYQIAVTIFDGFCCLYWKVFLWKLSTHQEK